MMCHANNPRRSCSAKLAELPVEQPTKFDIVINLTTAKALSITIPEQFLLRAYAGKLENLQLVAALDLYAVL
jgi:hypothetical protein